jgi:hypothetical protein
MSGALNSSLTVPLIPSLGEEFDVLVGVYVWVTERTVGATEDWCRGRFSHSSASSCARSRAASSARAPGGVMGSGDETCDGGAGAT